MGRKVESGYFAVIPFVVLFHEDLSANAKLLYCSLTNLSDSKGYCWASNEYLAGLFGFSVSSVSRWVSQLESLGFIRTEMVPTEKGSERRIYVGLFSVTEGGVRKNAKTPLRKNAKTGLRKNDETGLVKNADTPKGNILNINNITENIPPIVPQGGTAPSKSKNGKREYKAQPDWKPERFEGFWKYYKDISPGVNSGRQATIRAWDKLRPSDELIDRMGRALKRFAASDEWQRGIGIPHASTWLNQHRWEDADGLSLPLDPEANDDAGGEILRQEDSPWYQYKKMQESANK